MATDEELRKYAIRATHRIRLLLEIYAPEQLVREQVEYLAPPRAHGARGGFRQSPRPYLSSVFLCDQAVANLVAIFVIGGSTSTAVFQ